MDDINLASNNTKTQKKVKTGRKAWQYLFDIIIKTILCSAVISINFTLFANAGSYNLFSSATYGNLEAIYIYAAITSLSFVLILIASFIRPLENIVLSAVFALFAVAVINQFGLFEKQSGLLLLFDGLFSEDINIILYEHSHMITALIVFVVFWIILSLLSRSFIFYLTLGACAILGWLISEAYLNPEVKYFKEVAGLPNLKKENMGKNVIFLSFNDLTSINNLKNMNNDKQPNEYLSKTYNNIVGFYNTNNFTLYPNALVEHPDDAFANLVLSYNAKNLDVSAEDNILSSSAKEEYFDFKSLQQNKIQLKNNPLYDMLRKNDYKINVFQTRDIDTCYVNNKLSVSSCIEKINSPILLNGEQFTTFDKLVVLISQWLESTGMVNSINPLLKTLEYAGSLIPSEFAPKSVELGKVYSYNAIT
ncbi:MAG: hypothetical protein IKA30_00410, partial [Alphaproteobacteria bacterium]|nr:hypothetical protein [Alphaproteobacteria bacterium]